MNNKIKLLVALAEYGLAEMFDSKELRFCHRIVKNNNGIVREGYSLRYTIISLLGLNQIQLHHGQSVVDVDIVIEDIISKADAINNIGDLGLLMWLCALSDPGKIASLSSQINIESALRKYKDARQNRTTELSWFLSGLSHTLLQQKHTANPLSEIAADTFTLIKNNYSEQGIFGHMGQNSAVGRLRGRIGTFSDQVYPIYAFSKYYEVTQSVEAKRIASECAKKICELQGQLGQWWWRYDSIIGNTFGHYPVYAVHQDGMAPMALLAVSEINGTNYNHAILKGVDWVFGNNEKSFDFRDSKHNLIWRSFYRNKYRIHGDEILSFLKINHSVKQKRRLKILYECRPYHLGWILFAFSNKTGTMLPG